MRVEQFLSGVAFADETRPAMYKGQLDMMSLATTVVCHDLKMGF